MAAQINGPMLTPSATLHAPEASQPALPISLKPGGCPLSGSESIPSWPSWGCGWTFLIVL